MKNHKLTIGDIVTVMSTKPIRFPNCKITEINEDGRVIVTLSKPLKKINCPIENIIVKGEDNV